MNACKFKLNHIKVQKFVKILTCTPIHSYFLNVEAILHLITRRHACYTIKYVIQK